MTQQSEVAATAKSATETEAVRYLVPAELMFSANGAALRLTVGEERSYRNVSLARLFPLSDPQAYLSVRDGANKEIGILTTLDGLDAESRRAVEDALQRRYFVPIVRRILSVKERFGTLDWVVETDRGARTFTTRNLRDNLLQPSTERYLLTDVDGSRYDVPDIDQLDSASRDLLMRWL